MGYLNSRSFFVIAFVSALLLFGAGSIAAENAVLDDEESEIIDADESEIADTNLPAESSPESSWQALANAAHFTLKHELAYGVDDPQKFVINRSSFRTQWETGFAENYFARLDAKASYDFAFNSSEFSTDLKDEYQAQENVRELYLQRNFDNLSIKAGKQLVIWGKADGAVITDIMSPRDLTESVFTSLEDARIGQTMLVFDYYYRGVENAEAETAQRQWTLVLNPDVKVNKLAAAGHPYAFNFSSLLGSSSGSAEAFNEDFIQDDKPSFSWADMEVGLRWNQSWGKTDVSFMAAEVNEDLGNYRFDPASAAVTAEYPRYQMIGGGFNWGHNGFVWKGELGFKNNRQFTLTDLTVPSEHQVWDTAVGFDYEANGAYSFSLELTNQHILDWDSSLLFMRRDETILYGVWRKTWLNEILTTQYTAMLQLQDREALHRWEFIYDVSDHWNLELQLDYFATKETMTLLGQLEDKNRIALEATFDF